MRVVLFGPPGVGKGTQAQLLAERYDLYHLSTGILLRAAGRADTPLGRRVKPVLDAGRLVSDELVWEIVHEKLADLKHAHFILDGYPRTVQQAEWLLENLAEHNASELMVLSLEVPTEQIVERLSKRRQNKRTGEVYHLDFNPPPPDIPVEDVYQRKDDLPEAIRHRLGVYDRHTAPVKRYFKEHGYLQKVDGVGEIEDVHRRIVHALTAEPVGR